MSEAIQICFGLNDKTGGYSYHVGAVMQSIMEHTQAKLHFYILMDESVSEENKALLQATAIIGGAKINLIQIDSKKLGSEEMWGRFTSGAMMRLAAPELLHFLRRVIYLDADILVNRDIAELWEMDISQVPLAAVPAWVYHHFVSEVSDDRYFNSGVLYLNLERIRKDGSLLERALKFLNEHPGDPMPDQDAINHLYWRDYLVLDNTWNTVTTRIPEGAPLERRIYHFVNDVINLIHPRACDQLLEETILRTPWEEEPLLPRYRHEIATANNRLENLQQLAKRLAEKNRVRVYHGLDWDALKGVKEFLPPREQDFYAVSSVSPTAPSNMKNQKPLEILRTMDKDSYTVITAPVRGFEADIPYLEELGLQIKKTYFHALCLVDRNKQGFA